MGINLPMELGPTEETVKALLYYLVDVYEEQETPSESQQEDVAKKVHAAAVLYNYYHLNPEKEILKFDQFCNLAIKYIPGLRQYMRYMNQPNCPNLNDPENQLSITEKAIMDACAISETLREASSNISNMIKEWPVTKVAVFLIDSKKENCFIQFHSKLWSMIEKDLYFEGSGLGSESKKVSLKRDHDENGEDGLKEVAFSAVKEVTGINSKLKVLEDHVVYSLSQVKTATHFYIVQSTKSTGKYRFVPIKHVISRLLQGPLVKKMKDSWATTRVVEYYYLLPYAEIISKWFSSSNGRIQMEEGTADSDIIQGSHKSFKKEGEGNSKGVDKPLVCLHKGNQKAKMHQDNAKNLKNVPIINELKDKRVDGEKKSGIVSLHEDRKGMLVDAKRSKSSEVALRALLIKKQKLSKQRRDIEDELSLCDKKIQEISQGGSWQT